MKLFSLIQIIWGGLMALGNLGYLWYSGKLASVQQEALDSGDVSDRRARAIKTFLGIVDDTKLPAMLLIVCALMFVASGVMMQLKNRISVWIFGAAMLGVIVLYFFFILPLGSELTYLLHFRRHGESADGEPRSMLMMATAGFLLLTVPVISALMLFFRRNSLEAHFRKF